MTLLFWTRTLALQTWQTNVPVRQAFSPACAAIARSLGDVMHERTHTISLVRCLSPREIFRDGKWQGNGGGSLIAAHLCDEDLIGRELNPIKPPADRRHVYG